MATHITGKCPSCGADFRLRAHAAGRRAKCKSCQNVFIIPGQRTKPLADDDVMSWLERPNLSGSAEAKAQVNDIDDDDDEDDDDDAVPHAGAASPSTRA